MIIRYYSESKQRVVTSLYRLVLIESAAAECVAKAVLDCLKEDKFPFDKLIGIGVDGANAMVGCNHSVATILREKIPNLVVIRCICHSLHLAASHASEVLPRQLDFMVRETFKWFKRSTKRQIDYRDLYKCLTNQIPLKIINPAETRWLSRSKCIDRILSEWDELKLHFQLAKDKERCYTAETL